MAEQPIQNCELRFQFKCPKQWDALQETAEAGVRFCGECHKQVYLCQDTREAAHHARAGHCVAVPAGLVSPMQGHEIDPDLLRLVPLELALKYGAVPLRREGTSLVVAMSDPSTPHALDDLSFVSGYTLEVVLASRQHIQETLERATSWCASSATRPTPSPARRGRSTSRTAASASPIRSTSTPRPWARKSS